MDQGYWFYAIVWFLTNDRKLHLITYSIRNKKINNPSSEGLMCIWLSSSWCASFNWSILSLNNLILTKVVYDLVQMHYFYEKCSYLTILRWGFSFNLLNLLLLSIMLETIEKKCFYAILCKALSHSLVKGYYLGTLFCIWINIDSC